jgi:hypothetical protein
VVVALGVEGFFGRELEDGAVGLVGRSVSEEGRGCTYPGECSRYDGRAAEG